MSGVDSATSPGAGGFTPYYGRRWVGCPKTVFSASFSFGLLVAAVVLT